MRGVGVADCRWQSFCDLTESADESRPLQPNGMYVIFVGDGVLDIPHEHKAQVMRNNGNESSP